MTIKQKSISLLLLGLAVALFFAIRFGIQYAYIGSSYDAKITCSCLFISGRPIESIKKEDLYAVPFAHIQVDQEHKMVTSDIYGLTKTTAIYRPGLGCTLVNELTAEELIHQPRATIPDTTDDVLEKVNSLPGNIDSIKLFSTIEHAFKEADSNYYKRTRAIVILQHGKIIAERYAPGITADMPLLGWSMTKSVTNALIGILVKDGKLHVDSSAPVEEWKNDERNKITLNHLLRMSSGLDFLEEYSKPSNATHMLFRAHGAGKYALLSKIAAPPGTVWNYSSGTSNILQEIIRRQFISIPEYQAFPHQRLFDKIGMRSAVMEPDASGTYVGSSFMYATAQDWAKFGQLYLQNGFWNGEQILPEGWVAYSSKETAHSEGKYAAHFWINHADLSFPQDAFFADGFEGQYVVVIPSKQLVLVRLGCTQGSAFDFQQFVRGVYDSVK